MSSGFYEHKTIRGITHRATGIYILLLATVTHPDWLESALLGLSLPQMQYSLTCLPTSNPSSFLPVSQ